MGFFAKWIAGIVLMTALAVFLGGQAVDAKLFGNVKDEGGDNLPGVEVTVTEHRSPDENKGSQSCSILPRLKAKGTFRCAGRQGLAGPGIPYQVTSADLENGKVRSAHGGGVPGHAVAVRVLSMVALEPGRSASRSWPTAAPSAARPVPAQPRRPVVFRLRGIPDVPALSRDPAADAWARTAKFSGELFLGVNRGQVPGDHFALDQARSRRALVRQLVFLDLRQQVDPGDAQDLRRLALVPAGMGQDVLICSFSISLKRQQRPARRRRPPDLEFSRK